MNYNTR